MATPRGCRRRPRPGGLTPRSRSWCSSAATTSPIPRAASRTGSPGWWSRTGLPNAAFLAQRIREELARVGAREGALAVAVARIENLADVERSGDPVKTSRVVQRVVESLRSHARDFDVVCRCEDAEFAVLLPEPGHDPALRVLDIARVVAEDVAKDERINSPVRVALAFGYAVHPADGRDVDSLLVRAREPRIHMV